MLISGSDVAKHGSRASCWIVLHNKVWDVTDYINSHPGGEDVLANLAGQDASEAYDMMHNPELVSSVLPPAAYMGDFDPTTASNLKQPSPAASSPKSHADPAPSTDSPPPLSSIINANDFEAVAKQSLTPTGWAYYASGADDMLGIADTQRLWRLLKLRPRILRDVTAVDTSTTILGHKTSLPIYISPTGLGKYAHPDAECALARAAGKEGIVQVVPTAPSKGHDEITAAGREHGAVMMFQLYFNRDRARARATVERAEALGYKAIWVTVDSPVLGKREMDDRLKAKEGRQPSNATSGGGGGGGVAAASSSGLLNAGLVWADIRWLRALTSLPLVLKGVQSVEDAVAAWHEGLDGIVFSNHGGRSVDAAQAPIVTLLEIRRFAPYILHPTTSSPSSRCGAGQRQRQGQGRRFEVYLDGGVRRGTDALKALALGCTAVGVGRSFLYSMAGGYGEEGARRLIAILRAEVETNMALLGVRSVRGLEAGMVNARRVEMEVVEGGVGKL